MVGEEFTFEQEGEVWESVVRRWVGEIGSEDGGGEDTRLYSEVLSPREFQRVT
jgi:hypothetical protein